MSIFRNVVFVAALAGLVAGLAMSAMQFFTTTPLIVEAEEYEGMAVAAAPAATADSHSHGHDHGHSHDAGDDHGHSHSHSHEHDDHGHTHASDDGHAHDDDHGHTHASDDGHAHGGDHGHTHSGWVPEDGFQRESLTVLANVVTAIGFGLMLVVASELAGGIQSWRQGLYWGFAGFAVFTLAPGLGLPPELPGMPAADLVPRQIWWVATVAATAGGLALIAFGKGAVLALVGVALIVAPHIIGAPQPVSHDSLVPVELQSQFVTAATLTSLVFWLILGAMVGTLRDRFADPESGTEQGSVA